MAGAKREDEVPLQESAANSRNVGPERSSSAFLAGTRKGLFIARSDAKRREWTLEGPHLAGYEVQRAFIEPRDGPTAYATDAGQDVPEFIAARGSHAHLTAKARQFEIGFGIAHVPGGDNRPPFVAEKTGINRTPLGGCGLFQPSGNILLCFQRDLPEAVGRQTVGRPRPRLADLLIAATAVANGLPLFTRTPKNFIGVELLVDVMEL